MWKLPVQSSQAQEISESNELLSCRVHHTFADMVPLSDRDNVVTTIAPSRPKKRHKLREKGKHSLLISIQCWLVSGQFPISACLQIACPRLFKPVVVVGTITVFGLEIVFVFVMLHCLNLLQIQVTYVNLWLSTKWTYYKRRSSPVFSNGWTCIIP